MTTGNLDSLLQTAARLRQQGRIAEAEGLCAQILAHTPDHAGALHLSGLIAHSLGRSELAVELIERSLRFSPEDAVALSNLAEVLRALDRFEAAKKAGRQAVQLAPTFFSARFNLATILRSMHECDEALPHVRRAIDLQPQNPDAYRLAGQLFAEVNRVEEAITYFRAAIGLTPLFARGADAALSIDGRHLRLLNEFAEALIGAGRFKQARDILGQSLGIKPTADALLCLAMSHMRDRDPGTGLTFLNQALALSPDDPVLHFNRSVYLMLLGRLEEAWPEYEWRWRHPRLKADVRRFPQRQWDGSPLAGKRILLFSEQGYGDAVFFARYATLIAQRGAAEVILQVQPAMRECLASIKGPTQVIATTDPVPEFDVSLPLMSAPGVFKTTLETIPRDVPYITPDPVRMRHWQRELAIYHPRMKVGLVWEGGSFQPENYLRSCLLADFAPLAGVPDVCFFSLQKGPAAAQSKKPPVGMDFIDLAPCIRDFADTSAILATLDLLISVDTSVVHVAGALGKPVWTLLGYCPGHMWMLNRRDSPWYPTMRLFRQAAFRDWHTVIMEVRAELERECRNAATRG